MTRLKLQLLLRCLQQNSPYPKQVLLLSILAKKNLALGALDQLEGKNLQFNYIFSEHLIQTNSLVVFDQPAYSRALNSGNATQYTEAPKLLRPS